MNIITIPIKHISRKPFRSLLLTLVFSIGILSVVALNYVSKTVGENFEKKLINFGANILVYPKTDSLSLSYGGFNLGNLFYEVKYLKEDEVVNKIKNIEFKKNISVIAPKLIVPIKVDRKNAGVVGVIWEEELSIKSYWNLEKIPDKENQAIVGYKAAETLGVKKGSKVSLNNGNLEIIDILNETGAEDDNLIFANLRYLQNLTGKRNLVNFVEVAALCSGCPIDEIVYDISQNLPDTDVKALQQVIKQRMFTVKFLEKLALTVSMIILLTACFMIGLFMLASVNERKKEIGILRAIGYSKLNVFFIFSLEALFIGIFSGIVGYLGGYLISFKVLKILNIVEEISLTFSPVQLAFTILSVSVVSTLSAIVPSWKAARIEPSEALVIL